MAKHWQLSDMDWSRFDPSKVDPLLIQLVKAASVVERNGTDYAQYLCNVFHDDPDFSQASRNWAVEECQHGDALGQWATLADPSWDYPAAFAKYKAGYKVPLDIDRSVRGSRTGELIARCMVETGTSSFYTALAERTEEPVLQQVCKQIAADEYRHFKLFYDHMHRYLKREHIGVLRRTRIALGRVTETEDDELAFAFHVTNDPEGVAYEHERCIAGYMAGAMGSYRRAHLQRAVGMIFKTIGFKPHTRVADLATSGAWVLMQRRQRKFARDLRRAVPVPQARAAEPLRAFGAAE
jgi:hypothetical protein